MRRYDDLVEVRKGADEDPEQFLWRGTAVAGARGGRALGGDRGLVDPAHDGQRTQPDLLAEREVWRVTAARGRVAALQAAEHGGPGGAGADLGYGVFDLVFSWSAGSWQLVRAMD